MIYQLFRRVAYVCKHSRVNLASGDQQDAAEFLAATIDALEQELKSTPDLLATIRQFQGQEIITRRFKEGNGKCPKCQNIPYEYQKTYSNIQLVVPSYFPTAQLSCLLTAKYESKDWIQQRCSHCCHDLHPKRRKDVCSPKE